MPTVHEWEDWCLETFFLNAAVDGRIEAIEINDEKIIEFSGASDISGAHAALLAVLPPTLDYYLRGDMSPSFRAVGKAASRSLSESESRPNFVRILVFFLWLQITESKDKDEGDIRRMASSALKRAVPQMLVGLHDMWVRLEAWLRDRRDIVLVLPEHGHETHVGITKRLAFPTKRDLDLLRRVREDGHSRVDLRSVTKRIAGDQSFDRTSPAFRRAFESWQSAAVADEEAARELPFMSAWTRVLAEKDIGTTIVLSCDEFGEIEVQRRRADGRERTLQSDQEFLLECRRLGAKIGACAKRGLVGLSRTGLASWTLAESSDGDEYLVSRSAYESFDKSAHAEIDARGKIRYLTWEFVLVDLGATKKPAAQPISSLRFVDKIRVGARGTYLGRWPMTPVIAFPGELQPVLEIGGHSYRSVPVQEGVANFPEGTWNGAARARIGNRHTDVTLRSDAYPHADEDIRFFDRARHVPEDGVLHDTQPGTPNAFSVGEQAAGLEPDPRLVALQEAFYARSARTMSLQTAVDLASRVARTPEAPDVWDLVRLFVDSGWFDTPYISQVPARLLVQKRPSYRTRSVEGMVGVTIEGPIPVSLEEAMRRKAEGLGLRFDRNLGNSAWSLPKYWIGSEDEHAVRRFTETSDLGEVRSVDAPTRSRDWAVRPVAADYENTGTWNSAQKRFGGDYQTEPWPRLVRRDRPARDTYARYVVEHEDGSSETFQSANLALLRYLDLRNETAFVLSGNAIETLSSRFRLPSSWARWLSTVHLRNCSLAATEQGWICRYPATIETASALAELLPAIRANPTRQATESGILPWIERTRLRFAGDQRPIWHDGKLRALHDRDGLRTCSRERPATE